MPPSSAPVPHTAPEVVDPVANSEIARCSNTTSGTTPRRPASCRFCPPPPPPHQANSQTHVELLGLRRKRNKNRQMRKTGCIRKARMCAGAARARISSSPLPSRVCHSRLPHPLRPRRQASSAESCSNHAMLNAVFALKMRSIQCTAASYVDSRA
eukprot:366444-Chlamydomonas_euryale.AAC.21